MPDVAQVPGCRCSLCEMDRWLDVGAAQLRAQGLRGLSVRDLSRMRPAVWQLYHQERARLAPWVAAASLLRTIVVRTLWPVRP